MPNITTSGTFDASTEGLSGFSPTDRVRSIVISGASVGSSTELQYIDDTGTARTLEGGTITALPWSKEVKLNANLQIVTTGTPNFNIMVG